MNSSHPFWRRAILGLVIATLCTVNQRGSAQVGGVPTLWRWGLSATTFPDATDVWSAPVLAHLFDTNGDGLADQNDDASLVFISGNTVDPNSGLGTSCMAT